jgi:DNA-binding beta-propeller fold protein YncE
MAVLLAVLALAVAAVTLTSTPWSRSVERAPVFPARLVLEIKAPVHPGESLGKYGQPADVVEIDGVYFVLDTGNNRILAQDRVGTVMRVIDGSAGEGYRLDEPMALASDGRLLYVANTRAAQVLILDRSGALVRAIDLAATAPADVTPRPVGLALTADGGIVVSDLDNNRLLYFDAEGTLLRTVGAGARAAGSGGFNAPGGVTVDEAGFTYVADILNGRVAKVSPEGEIVQQFGRPGDTAGTFSRPKDVAVDAAGNVYVSDGLLAAVQVFDAGGAYLGFIGRADPEDRRSGSLFMAPAGISVAGDKLYVMDRFAGLLVFDLPG